MAITEKRKLIVPASKNEFYYLEGPKSRLKEFMFTIEVIKEFITAFRKLHFVGPCVTVFGSARYPENHKYYALAYEIGKALTKQGFSVMTGGGPGIMEAANRGSFENDGISVGAEIELPMEQVPNKYLHAAASFKYFFVRKFLLFKYSYAFIALPGGVGTMDELFEALTLIQTKKIKDFPIVLMGKEYYKSLVNLLEHMAEEGTIDKTDLNLMLITDSIDEAIQHIQTYSIEKYGLKKFEPQPILGETVYSR